ncbi:hypothetical protein F4825DRAFT_302382 [Nemania diffusa]|nr:hypothetical protein F4825DRAFT_302382 [Nemania diffusa]
MFAYTVLKHHDHQGYGLSTLSWWYFGNTQYRNGFSVCIVRVYLIFTPQPVGCLHCLVIHGSDAQRLLGVVAHLVLVVFLQHLILQRVECLHCSSLFDFHATTGWLFALFVGFKGFKAGETAWSLFLFFSLLIWPGWLAGVSKHGTTRMDRLHGSAVWR